MDVEIPSALRSVKMPAPTWQLLAALLWALMGSAEAKVVHGYIRTGDNWRFLSRFCFLSIHGQFQYEIQYQEDFSVRKFKYILDIYVNDIWQVQNIDLYYDTPEQWERVYGSKSDLGTCQEKESVLQVK